MEDILNKLNISCESLRQDNGLYFASAGEHYVGKVWLRDLYFQTLEVNREDYITSWSTFLDYAIFCEKNFKKFTYIMDLGREAKPFNIRWDATKNKEINEEWGHLQLDAWGMALMAIAKEGDVLLQKNTYRDVVLRMILSLNAYEFYTMEDCGAWEENHEVRMSSIACVAAGLYDIRKYFPKLHIIIDNMLQEATKVIKEFGTKETCTRNVDLAQLHGVMFCVPRGLMSKEQGTSIVENIEDNLLRPVGVIRYLKDEYYNVNLELTKTKYNGVFNENKAGEVSGGEAVWTFGLPKLVICRKLLHLPSKQEYIDTMKTITEEFDGYIPELFYADTLINNDNTPLGWSCNLFRVVLSGNY